MWRVWQVWQWCRLGYVPLLGLHTAATQFSPPPHPVGLGLPPFTVLFVIIPRLSHIIDVESIMEPPDPHQLVTTFGRLSPSQSRNVCAFPRTPVRQVAVTVIISVMALAGPRQGIHHWVRLQGRNRCRKTLGCALTWALVPFHAHPSVKPPVRQAAVTSMHCDGSCGFKRRIRH